jgi:hypothetical protein
MWYASAPNVKLMSMCVTSAQGKVYATDFSDGTAVTLGICAYSCATTSRLPYVREVPVSMTAMLPIVAAMSTPLTVAMSSSTVQNVRSRRFSGSQLRLPTYSESSYPPKMNSPPGPLSDAVSGLISRSR